MITNTTNYKLIKPDNTEMFDIEHFNENAEIIDKVLSNKSETGHTHDDIYYTKSETNDLVGDVNAKVNNVASNLAGIKTEQWKFVLEDGTIVIKEVYVR